MGGPRPQPGRSPAATRWILLRPPRGFLSTGSGREDGMV